MITQQEILQRVYNHEMTQKAQSITHSGACLYLSPDGKKCYVGIFLPEDLARAADAGDDSSVATLAEKEVLPPELVEHIFLLSNLQEVHDQNESSEKRLKILEEIAENLGIELERQV